MQQAAEAMSSASPTPLSLVSTEQIQKYLDENKNLILAILESQKMGKVAECAQYQAILQRNLMYLAAIADAQPQESSIPLQPLASSVVPQGNPNMVHFQGSMLQQQQQQPGASVSKLPFQLNTLQQNQFLHLQQHQKLQGEFNLGGRGNNSLHPSMQHGLGNSATLMDMRANHHLEPSSGNGHGHSISKASDGRE